mgnify:FL=1
MSILVYLSSGPLHHDDAAVVDDLSVTWSNDNFSGYTILCKQNKKMFAYMDEVNNMNDKWRLN